LPTLVTSSYTGYQRSFGTAVRISRGAPRFISLPDPRWTNAEHWPFIAELSPAASYIKAAEPTYRKYYLQQLEANAEIIERKLAAMPAEFGKLCLLCYEKGLTAPGVFCHRRMFADWWQERTGKEVAEVGGGR